MGRLSSGARLGPWAGLYKQASSGEAGFAGEKSKPEDRLQWTNLSRAFN